jgi:hypothetical protein
LDTLEKEITSHFIFSFKATLYSIQPSAVKSMLRHHGIQAVTRVMAYVANAVTLGRCLQQCVLAALN